MKLTFRIWLLIALIALSLIAIFSIPPQFLEKGVIIKYIQKNSSASELGLQPGMILSQINSNVISNIHDYYNFGEIFADNSSHKLEIITNKGTIIGLFDSSFMKDVLVSDIENTRIKTGLDISGGARALVTSEDHKLTSEELTDLIAISQERLNVYGIADVNIRRASDLSGNNFMVVEIAGATPADLKELVGKQGKFEAKIGNETAFEGGKKDIASVCRTDATCSRVETCGESGSGYACRFSFTVYLSEQAAQRHANITGSLGLNLSEGRYLDKKLDLYLDDQLVDTLLISEDLKGRVTTQIAVSGSGMGNTREEAYNNAKENMKKLQTVLITGGLPFKLTIVKTDSISPVLGNSFVKTILIAGFFAILAVSIVIFARYRKIKVSLSLLIVSFSELIIILGVASLIKWNLDLPSIAGIIATIGTGVDSQIVILDE